MTMAVNVAIGLVQLVVAILFSVVALYAGMFTFSTITGGFDAPGELKKGNVAVGILVASIFIGISLAVDAGVRGVLTGLDLIAADGMITAADGITVGSSVAELALSILLAIGSVYGVMYGIARFHPAPDALREIKQGNTAMAFVFASVIILVCTIVHYGVDGIIRMVF
ncbi:MAG TPA: DUF350 domain-containing protein [Methanoregula sp.]|nr:DUF350 domain-containing protein [Methanoregula sp.]